MVIVAVDADVAPLMVAPHHDRRLHPRLHEQVGISGRDLVTDADAGLEEAIAVGIVHIGIGHLPKGIVIIGIGPGKVVVQGQRFLHIRIVVLQDLVEDVLDHGPEFFDPGGGFIHGHEIGEAGDAVLDGVLPIPCIVDELGQHRETPFGELAHDPVIGVLIRAGEGILSGHDRVHQVVPGLAHGLAEKLLHIGYKSLCRISQIYGVLCFKLSYYLL